MKNGNLEPLMRVLLNQQNVQFFAGILQRYFEWDKRDYEKWVDAVMNAHHTKYKFVDRIVTRTVNDDNVCHISLTDGQQRTTMLLLSICAVCAFVKNNNIPEDEFNYKYVVEDYLINPRKDGEDRYKLLLRKKDKDTLKMIIDELPVKMSKNAGSPKIISAYTYLYEKLNEDNYQQFFNNLNYLYTLEFKLEPDDDENEIFDAINGTGKPVSLFDKIRGHCLKIYPLQKQEELDEKYWEEISLKPNSISIIRMFTFYKRSACLHTDVYSEFKELYSSYEDPEKIQEELYNFHKTLEKLYSFNTGDEELDFILQGLNLVFPPAQWISIVKIYSMYELREINKKELIKSLQLLLNVGLRWKLVYTNTLNFRVLLETNIKWISSDNLYLRLRKELQRFEISDTKFIMTIQSKNFYRGSKDKFELENKDIPSNIDKITDYLLISIENAHHGKGRINLNHYNKDHVLSQDLTEEWGKIFTEEQHHDYVHSLGNLTLIAKSYNSSMGNDPFVAKKNNPNGYKDDKLHINKSIIAYEVWSVDSIRQRTELLAEELCKIFKIPADDIVVNKSQSILVGGK